MKSTPLKRGTKPLKRKSKNPKKTAKDKAWKELSKWVRANEPNCVTCGASTTEAGHFIHGVTLTKLYLEPKIVHGQCGRCNRWLHGNLAPYTIFMINKYGKEEVERLLALKGSDELSGDKPTLQWYQQVFEKYRDLNASST